VTVRFSPGSIGLSCARLGEGLPARTRGPTSSGARTPAIPIRPFPAPSHRLHKLGPPLHPIFPKQLARLPQKGNHLKNPYPLSEKKTIPYPKKNYPLSEKIPIPIRKKCIPKRHLSSHAPDRGQPGPYLLAMVFLEKKNFFCKCLLVMFAKCKRYVPDTQRTAPSEC